MEVITHTLGLTARRRIELHLFPGLDLIDAALLLLFEPSAGLFPLRQDETFVLTRDINLRAS